MGDFKILNRYLWIITTFLIPGYYKDNLDIQKGFHPNKNMIFMVNWYPKIKIICWNMWGIIITTRITNLTIISTNQYLVIGITTTR